MEPTGVHNRTTVTSVLLTDQAQVSSPLPLSPPRHYYYYYYYYLCGVKLKDRLPSKELRERLGVDDIALILQQNRLRWYGHVLRKDDDDWVKKCIEYEVEGSRPRGRPKRTWKQVVREDCQACKLNKEFAVDRCKWRKVIKEVR